MATKLTLRDLIHRAQRRDLPDDEPDRSMDHIAAACNVNRGHLFDLMNGKPDPSKVKVWTLHRLSKGLDCTLDEVREAIENSRRKARRKSRRSSLVD